MNWKKQRIAAWWENFIEHAMHPEATEIQKREMRKAFYIGVWTLFTAQKAMVDVLTEQQAARVFDAFEAELDAFLSEQVDGAPAPLFVVPGGKGPQS